MIEDIFEEDKISPIKGLLQRYKDRVLIELTFKCPSECAFCYRKWRRSQDNLDLNIIDVDRIIDLISKNKKISQVIFSGGEPLLRLDLLEYLMNKLSKFDHVKIFRIHTRAPVSKPDLVSKEFLRILNKKYKQIIYLSIHINSADELTEKTENAIKKIKETGAILYSQSVFLKGINDSVESLEKLFLGLLNLGVRPYNIYHCNKVEGNDNYIVPIKQEVQIMTDLRKRITGLACPTLIFDIPGNANKIPAPNNFWDVNLKKIKDFDGSCLETRQLE